MLSRKRLPEPLARPTSCVFTWEEAAGLARAVAMKPHPFALLTAVVLLPVLAPPAPAAEATGPRGDEQTLRAAGLPTDDAALLDFFQRRTQSAVGAGRLTALVRDLGDAAADK